MPSKQMLRRERKAQQQRRELEREKDLALSAAACPIDRAYLTAQYEREMTGRYPEVGDSFYLYELGLTRRL